MLWFDHRRVEKAVDGLIPGPFHLAKASASAVQPRVACVEGAGHRREAQSVPASTRSRSGAGAGSQATAAPLAHPQRTVNCTVIPARVQLLTLESHSVSSHFLLLVLPLFCPQLGLRHRQMLGPSELTSGLLKGFKNRVGEGRHVCVPGEASEERGSGSIVPSP